MTMRLNHRWRVVAIGSAWRLEERVGGAWRPRYQARTPEALRELIAAKCDRPLNEEAAIVLERLR